MRTITFFTTLIFLFLLSGCKLEDTVKVSINRLNLSNGNTTEVAHADPLKSYVTLLIPGTGTNGSTVINDILNGPLVANDSLVISTATYSTGAIKLDGIESTVTGIPQAAVTIGNDSFCFEAFVTASPTDNTYYELLFDTSGNGSAIGGLFIELSTQRGFVFAANTQTVDYPTYPTDGLEHHWMVSRDNAGLVRIGLDGIIVNSLSMPGFISADPMGGAIGNYTNSYTHGSGYAFSGSIRGLRLTIGQPRYEGNYTIPTLPLNY